MQIKLQKQKLDQWLPGVKLGWREERGTIRWNVEIPGHDGYVHCFDCG